MTRRLAAAGIVAEYNPLHGGHAYHISKSRECAGSGAVIAVISSNFVQRGEPALTDKRARAEAALAAGADLVIELPVIWSCASAGAFAAAAVDLLAAAGAEAISFGMESPGPLAKEIARAAARETPDFREALRRRLGEGHSFAQARALALGELIRGADAFLREPNNSLAVSYMARIYERGYDIEPIMITRTGSRHDGAGGGRFASSSAIRELLRAGEEERAFSMMPDESAAILRREMEAGRAVIELDLYWRLAKSAIARADAGELARSAEMAEGFENRMLRAAFASGSLEEFVDAASSRRTARGRARRHAARVLLGLGADESREFQRRGPAYIRVLGANERGRAHLRELKKNAPLPITSRPSAPFGEYAERISLFEHRAAELRELCAPVPRPRAEAVSVPVMV